MTVAVSDPVIVSVSAADLARRLPEFGALIEACVAAGASISFVLPFGRADGEAFFRDKVLPGLAAGTSSLVAALAAGQVVGCLVLDCDTPPNQPHRAELRKLMVHPDHRRLGLARRMLEAQEREALGRGRTLITLDTRTGDAAEPLYESRGYTRVGVIPRFCVDTLGSGRLDGTTIFYKHLSGD
jgi:ribosomal protein S18 acetylase RimI-like enzyme